jgi:hypothetical protein
MRGERESGAFFYRNLRRFPGCDVRSLVDNMHNFFVAFVFSKKTFTTSRCETTAPEMLVGAAVGSASSRPRRGHGEKVTSPRGQIKGGQLCSIGRSSIAARSTTSR